MTRRIASFVIAIAVGMFCCAAQAFPPLNPYVVPPAEIQGSLDRTGDFSGNNQASTQTHANISGGIDMDVTWSTGAAGTNETFTRIVLTQRFPGDNGDGDGGDLDAFDGVTWSFLSDTPFVVKPFSQTYNGFAFYEGSQDLGAGTGIIQVPANTPTLVQIDWNMVGAGSIPAANRGNMFEIGFQIFGPSPPQDGTTIASNIQITNVPEPATLGMACLGGLAMIAVTRRRRRA